MSVKKYTVFSIIFLVVIPFKVMFGQEVASDTAQTEADIKYDSVMVKAANAFSDSSYKEAIEYYKEASIIKPQESYPLKMITYVEITRRDVEAKQKQADEIKRKAQIQSDLVRANEAIFEKNWSGAKSLFNEILSLHPEKPDEDFARSKIAAIDLELQRIAARTPVKEEPKPVYVPKNKREARVMRREAERSAILAAATNKQMSQKPAEVTKSPAAPLPAATSTTKGVAASNTGSAIPKKISYQILQRFNEDFKDVSSVNWIISSDYYKASFIQDEERVEAFYDANGVLIGTSRHISTSELPREAKKIFATKYASYTIKEVIRYEGAEEIAYYISTQDDKEKVVFKLTGSRDIAVFSRGAADKSTLAGVDFNKGTGAAANQTSATKNSVAASSVPPPLVQAQRQTVVQTPQKKTPAAISTPVAPAPQQTAASNSNLKNTPPPPSATKTQQVPSANSPSFTPLPAETGAATNSGLKNTSPVHTQQAPANVQANNSGIAQPSAAETYRQSAATRLPERKAPAATAPTQQKAIAGSMPDRLNPAQPSSNQSFQQKPAETLPARNAAANAPISNQTLHPAAGASLPDRKIVNTPPTKEMQQQPVASQEGTGATSVASTGATAAPTTTAAAPLHLSDSSDNIKLICQDISFIGSNVYTKVLIQNYSEYTEFATDTLLVSLKKNNGNIVRLDQRFISTFPVIEPLGEYVLVSLADAPETIANDDVFIIQMKNKRQQSKLTIQVPWGRYSQSKNF